MSGVTLHLKRAAREIRKAGHLGWGNVIDAAVDEIKRLEKQEPDTKASKSKGRKCLRCGAGAEWLE